MKSKVTVGLYLLLIVLAVFSMVYYIAGVLALREEFFHASRYARAPFDFRDDGETLSNVSKEATVAGLSDGDILLAVDGARFTGEAQLHDVLLHTNPGKKIAVSVREASGNVREVQIRLAPREGPDFSLGGYIALLAPILGVPLLGLLRQPTAISIGASGQSRGTFCWACGTRSYRAPSSPRCCGLASFFQNAGESISVCHGSSTPFWP
jgi:hypothetical protein